VPILITPKEQHAERLKLLGYNINDTLNITCLKNVGTTVVISLKI